VPSRRLRLPTAMRVTANDLQRVCRTGRRVRSVRFRDTVSEPGYFRADTRVGDDGGHGYYESGSGGDSCSLRRTRSRTAVLGCYITLCMRSPIPSVTFSPSEVAVDTTAPAARFMVATGLVALPPLDPPLDPPEREPDDALRPRFEPPRPPPLFRAPVLALLEPPAREPPLFADARFDEDRFAEDFFADAFFAERLRAPPRFADERFAEDFFADDFFAARFAPRFAPRFAARFAPPRFADDFFAPPRFADDFFAAPLRAPVLDAADAPDARVLRRAAPLRRLAPLLRLLLLLRRALPEVLPEDFERVAIGMLLVRRCAPRVCKN